MKRIEAIIRVDDLAAVSQVVSEMGAKVAFVQEATGMAMEPELRPGVHLNLVPRYRFVAITEDDSVPSICSAILDVCQTGAPGDGKIFISEVDTFHSISADGT